MKGGGVQAEQRQHMMHMDAAGVGYDVAPLDDDDDPYTDRRWREILLQPAGSRWEDLLPKLLSPLLQQSGPSDSLLL